jgi:hypothetical protein
MLNLTQMILSELQPVTSVLEQNAQQKSKNWTLSKWGATSSPRRSRKIGTCLWYWKTWGSVRRDIGRCWDNAPRELLKSRKSCRYWKSRWNPSYNHWKSLKYNFTTNIYQQDHCDHLIREACLGSPTQAVEVWAEVSASLYWGTQQGEVTCTGTIWKTLGRLWKTMENYGRFKAYSMFSFLDLKWHSAQCIPMCNLAGTLWEARITSLHTKMSVALGQASYTVNASPHCK